MDALEGLRDIVEQRKQLDDLEARYVDDALGHGRSWSEIAEALGISKQAAHKRHSKRTRQEAGKSSKARQGRLLVTGQARRVVEMAREEAAALGSKELKREHLLLGLLRDDHGTAVRALEGAGVTLDHARAALGGRRRRRRRAGRRVEVSANAREALEQSLGEAVQLRDSHLGVEHLLLALLRDPAGPPSQLLEKVGVAPADVNRRVHELVGQPG